MIPALLVTWNRPETTQRVVSRLLSLRPSALYVAGDGPRELVEGDRDLIERVQDLVVHAPWECPVHYFQSPSHLGLRRNVLRAVDWFFSQVPEGVILEDDVLPSKDFFRFSGQMLERFRSDDKVASISGSAHANGVVNSREDFYFSSLHHVWGFGSWKRAWDGFSDFTLERKPVNEAEIRELLPNMPPGFSRHWAARVNSEISGEKDTWSALWNLFCFEKFRRSIVPRVALTENIGFGDAATNSKKIPLVAGYPPLPGSLPQTLRGPSVENGSVQVDAYVALTQWPTQPKAVRFLLAGLEHIRRLIHKLGQFVPVRFLARLVAGKGYDPNAPYLTVAQLYYARRLFRPPRS